MYKTIETTLNEMGLGFETDGLNFVHSSRGRYAPLVNSVISVDEDESGATITTILLEKVAPNQRTAVCELLNMVHGQTLWNVRFHLDDDGRVFSIGKHFLWGRPFSAVQFGDIFFTLLVTTDRLYPCLTAITQENLPAAEAFERFFITRLQDAQDV